MRLAPVPMFLANDPELAIRISGDSSRTTHGTRECIDACRYLGALIVGALHGAPKDELLADHYDPIGGIWGEEPLSPRIADIAAGSSKRKEPPEIKGTGYVVDCLEAALWAFDRSETFRDGALLAEKLGVNVCTVRNWESGRSTPRRPARERLAQVTGLKVAG